MDHGENNGRRFPFPTPRRPAGSGGPADTPPTEDELDFGNFVSRRVRDSSSRLKGEPPAQEEHAPELPPSELPGRPSRKWRDAVAQDDALSPSPAAEPARSGSRRFLDDDPDADLPNSEFDDEDDREPGSHRTMNGWFAAVTRREQDHARLIVVAIIVLIVIALLIFALSRFLGSSDGNGGAAIPTATQDQTDDLTTLPLRSGSPEPTMPPAPTSPPAPTNTPEVQPGGDNQLSRYLPVAQLELDGLPVIITVVA